MNQIEKTAISGENEHDMMNKYVCENDCFERLKFWNAQSSLSPWVVKSRRQTYELVRLDLQGESFHDSNTWNAIQRVNSGRGREVDALADVKLWKRRCPVSKARETRLKPRNGRPQPSSRLFLVNFDNVVVLHLQGLGRIIVVYPFAVKEETQRRNRNALTLTANQHSEI